MARVGGELRTMENRTRSEAMVSIVTAVVQHQHAGADNRSIRELGGGWS